MSDPDSESKEAPKTEPDAEAPVPNETETAVPVNGDPEPAKELSEEKQLPNSSDQDEAGRRDFLQKAGSVVLGGAMMAAPAAIGLRVVASPLFGDKANGVLARLTTLDAILPGGPPQAFKVVADKKDAWTTYKDLPLGLVYAQRDEKGDLTVFSAICPHAGCAVEYRKSGAIGSQEMGEHYYCPCHTSAFDLAGEIATDGSPAKRGLDTLEVDEEKLAAGEVWVRFRKFKAGVAEKKAIS